MSSSKTCVITTYHKSLSYGGCLQAYATLLLLESLGYKACFLDYENSFEARRKSNDYLRLSSPGETIKTLVKRLVFQGERFQRIAFDGFHDAMPKTPREYKSVDQMDDVEADVLLVASDQVWNPEITNGIEKVFLLAFGPEEAKRISFASSMGSHLLTANEREEFSEYLSRFDAISVREAFAKKQLSEIVHKNVTVCMDPTLQLSSALWQNHESPIGEVSDGDYILVFMVSSDESRFVPVLKRLKEAMGLPTVMVRLNSKKPNGVDSVIPATPMEFVYLVNHAAMVLTDSFHGVAFSINMNTPFYVLPNRTNNVRISELLSLAGLSSRLLEDDVLPDLIEVEVDFSSSNRILEQRRGEDCHWLTHALDGEME